MPLSKRSRPAGTCLLADDLTGACDAAVAFAARGFETEVLLQEEFGSSSGEVQAFSTNTRDVAAEIAVGIVTSYVIRLESCVHLFKKVDSVFRGNTFLEIVAAVRAAPHRLAVIAPAAPRHGRTCTDGLLYIRDLSGCSVVPVRRALADAGLQPVWVSRASAPELKAEMETASRNGAQALFCEASTDDDLANVVQAARALDKPLLWIGSSGLAHVLAETLHPESAPVAPISLSPGKVLLFSGSNHPVTHLQFLHLRDSGHDVLSIRVERDQTKEEEIREVTAHVFPGDVACLVMNGGDTALHVCCALSIDSIRLRGEFAPGIPTGVIVGGRFDGSAVILKSGGLGEADLFTQIARRTLVREEQPA